jgi:molybdate transport system substrate-binding protein
MKKSILILGLFINSLFAGEINVAVAANVSYAIDELKSEFAKLHPDTKVNITLGSSGKLTAQIKNGAPYQLFMAANMNYPQALYDEGIAITAPIVYAQGGLAYLSSNPKDFAKGIELVKDPKIKKIAIANPKTAPYGKAAVEAMQNAKVYATAKPKLVYAESISQTVAYTIAGADLGFVAKSSLYSNKMQHYKRGVDWFDVDAKLYTPIDQGVVVLKSAKEDIEARALYDFILSFKAKNIFEKYGYIVP